MLGLAVVGLEVGVADRPRRRDAAGVLEDAEVFRAEARQACPVDLGVAADVVMHARGERAPRAGVLPWLGVAIAPVAEHGRRRPVRVLARQEVAALNEQDALARTPQRPG